MKLSFIGFIFQNHFLSNLNWFLKKEQKIANYTTDLDEINFALNLAKKFQPTKEWWKVENFKDGAKFPQSW